MTAPRHWAAINEVSFVAGMRFLFWVCRVAGRWPFRLVLYPVLAWYLLTKPRARRASNAYLRRVRAYTGTGKTGLTGVAAHFSAFAESILDKMLLWGGLFPLDQVAFSGMALIAKAIEEKRGALIICAHLGNLELCRVLSTQRRNVVTTVLVHTKHAVAFNRMLGQLNPKSQMNLLQVTEMNPATAMLLAEKVGRGELVVIAGDRVPIGPRPRVALASFMGAPAAFPVGAYVLANILQCPVFMLFTSSRAGRAEVHFEQLSEAVTIARKGRDTALAQLAAAYAARLEYYCLRAPLQWFNFYDFWHLPEHERLDTPDAPR